MNYVTGAEFSTFKQKASNKFEIVRKFIVPYSKLVS